MGLLSAGLLSAAVYLTAVLADAATLRLYSKAIPVLLLAVWLLPERTRDARLVSAGLVLSALGDFLLEASPRLFTAGLTAFLLGHVAYAVAFVGRTRRAALTFLAPILIAAAGFFLWLLPRLGNMTFPVLAYVAVISVMVWRAAAQIADPHIERRTAWFAALGAISFFCSDMLVAYNSFVAPILALKILLMLLYWAGQCGIAASARSRATTGLT